MRSMKKQLLYIGNKLSRHGQTPTTVETLGEQLQEDYDVVTVSDKKDIALRMIDMMVSVLTNPKADYVLIDTYSSKSFYYALAVGMLCRIVGKPYIPILHGGNLPQRLADNPQLCRALFAHSFANVSPSPYLQHAFAQQGYEGVRVIPNNIDIQTYSYKRRDTFAPRILWVRAFAKPYNCVLAIEVMRLLTEHYSEAQLCMVGPDRDGTLQEVLDLRKQYGLEDKVLLPGRMTREEWHTLSEEYDIFLSTTNFDNTPVSLIEAMALGLPVISTRVGGVPYMVEEGKEAYLVEPNDAKAIAERIVYIVTHAEEVRQVCECARKKAEQFDWQVVHQQWRELLG